MNKFVSRIGLGAALASLLAFLMYIISFVAILLHGKMFVWTNLADFVDYSNQYNSFFKDLAMVFMLVYSICYVIEMVCIEESVDPSRRFPAKLAGLFGLGFAVLTGINYFVQLTSVRLQIQTGNVAGLEQFIMSYPISGIAGINMLGWTVFLGLSSLCIAFCFGKSRAERFCTAAFLANAVFMLVAAVAFAANMTAVLFICMYLGLGGTMLATNLGLYKYFRNK